MPRMSEETQQEAPGEWFGIGAVVARTGLSAAVIRMWEKRYGAVEPRRTDTNRRLFSPRDVQRLARMKQLTDRGHAISRIAGLGAEQLQALIKESGRPDHRGAPAAGNGPGRLLLAGPSAGEWVSALDLGESEVLEPCGSIDELVGLAQTPRADLLVVETDTLFSETVDRLREVMRRSGALRAVLVYRFAKSGVVRELSRLDEDLIVLRGPLSLARMRRECLLQLRTLFPEFGGPMPVDAGPIPARRFNAAQLGRLASISRSVDCECPLHMAELLKSLTAFEAYSEACEDRNADDALLHGFLHRTTARVRRTMENALDELLRVEGIEL